MRAPRGEPALEESLERYQRRLRGKRAERRGVGASSLLLSAGALTSAAARFCWWAPPYPAVPYRRDTGCCGWCAVLRGGWVGAARPARLSVQLAAREELLLVLPKPGRWYS